MTDALVPPRADAALALLRSAFRRAAPVTAAAIGAAFVLALLAEAASAQTLRVRPDGQVRFEASADGPTRISVVGDRIAKIVQTESQFEMSNDEDTGDVFLRFIGSDLKAETGYIITEGGHTVSFQLLPRRSAGTRTVLIELVGIPQAGAAAGAGREAERAAFAVDGAGEGGGSSAGGHANDLVAFVRAAWNAEIGFKRAGEVRRSGVFATHVAGGLKASIRSVKASSAPTPQQFFTPKTLAIFIDDVATRGGTPEGRVWVVVVEATR